MTRPRKGVSRPAVLPTVVREIDNETFARDYPYDAVTLECERIEKLALLLELSLMNIEEHCGEGGGLDVEQVAYGLALVAGGIAQYTANIRDHARPFARGGAR